MRSDSRSAGTIDRLAREIFERLSHDHDEAGVDDPQAYLERHVAEVQSEWRAAGIEFQDGFSNEREFTEFLRSAVDELPPRQRIALLLHANEDLTAAQIATRQQSTQQMVVQDLVDAYARLTSLARRRFPGLGF